MSGRNGSHRLCMANRQFPQHFGIRHPHLRTKVSTLGIGRARVKRRFTDKTEVRGKIADSLTRVVGNATFFDGASPAPGATNSSPSTFSTELVPPLRVWGSSKP